MSEAWKAVIDADLKNAEYTPRTPLQDGTYDAVVSNVEAKVFRSGSKGLEVTYRIESEGDAKGKEIRDYFVVATAAGAPNPQGTASIKKLLIEGGIELAKIKTFKFPDFATEGKKTGFGDFKNLLEQPYTIEVKTQVQKKGENAGKSFPRVNTFRMREAA